MGCWDETCGLTNTIVRTGDPCVMVVIKPGGPSPYISHTFGNQPWDLRQVQEIHKGTYNDYGWISEVDIEHGDPRNDYFICFFHRRVWDEVVAFEKDKKEIEDVRGAWAVWNLGGIEILELKRMAAEAKPDDEDAKRKYEELLEEHCKIPDGADEFLYIACFANLARRDIISGPRWRGHQDYDGDDRRELVHRLSMEHQAEWRYQTAGEDCDGIDQYGRYCLEEEGDPESKVEPESPTLSERIADVLRTDDKWGWREAINIHNYTPFELLREAQAVLRAIEISGKHQDSLAEAATKMIEGADAHDQRVFEQGMKGMRILLNKPIQPTKPENADKYHGCHDCGEERKPKLLHGKLLCPECDSENIVCIEND